MSTAVQQKKHDVLLLDEILKSLYIRSGITAVKTDQHYDMMIVW